MEKPEEIESFIAECAVSLKDESGDKKFIGWETLITLLIYEGIRTFLPEIREWFKLGMTVITLKRLEIRKKLIEFAKKKELEFPQAEKAAKKVSDRLDDAMLKRIMSAVKD